MNPSTTRPRGSFFLTMALYAAAAALVLSAAPASAQPIPVTRLAYSAKYMCGGANFADPAFAFAPGNGLEMTVIEVHNPHTTAIVCTVKVVQDMPFQTTLTPKYPVTLAANGTMEFNCSTLFAGVNPVPMSRGFVEIISPRQIKVVALYKEFGSTPGFIRGVAIAKKSCPPIIIFNTVSHSGTFLCGNTPTGNDTVRHETLISITNMSPNPVNGTIKILSSTGVVTSLPLTLAPNGFKAVTEANLPPAVPRPFTGSVVVSYPDIGIGAYVDCEEIIQKYAIQGVIPSQTMGMSVIEVQPIPLR